MESTMGMTDNCHENGSNMLTNSRLEQIKDKF